MTGVFGERAIAKRRVDVESGGAGIGVILVNIGIRRHESSCIVHQVPKIIQPVLLLCQTNYPT